MALFQAYLVQGTAWRSVMLQDVRENRRLPPRMGTEFGCKICILCADSLQSSVSKFSYCVQMCVCILRFQSVLASVFADSNCCALVLSSMSYDRKMNSVFTCIF